MLNFPTIKIALQRVRVLRFMAATEKYIRNGAFC